MGVTKFFGISLARLQMDTSLTGSGSIESGRPCNVTFVFQLSLFKNDMEMSMESFLPFLRVFEKWEILNNARNKSK